MTTWNRRRVRCDAPVRRPGAAHSNDPASMAGVLHTAGTAGFTLLEILVAVAVVALALVAFMGLQVHSLDDTIRAQDLTTAVLLAQGKLATMGDFPDTGEEQG